MQSRYSIRRETQYRADAAFDFAPVLTSFAKAIEVQTNAVLRRLWPKIDEKLRRMNIKGRTEDLGTYGSLDLGTLARSRFRIAVRRQS